ncbi:MAG: hypothetical protein K0U98_10535 [Deltaproteobacteria bacterium]|nr:hypothetical protein [Deltaproteobacteria bacterium]
MSSDQAQASRRIFSRNRCELTDRDRHNQGRIKVWGLSWMGSFLAIFFGSRWELLHSPGVALVLALVSTALGVKTILAYRHFLSEADELRRKIELDALALGFGVGVVGSFSYFLLERTGWVTEQGLPIVLILMMLAHIAGKVLGQRRYS